MEDNPFALLITWTTYGSWLPGDQRGHTSNTYNPVTEKYAKKQNRPTTPVAGADDSTFQQALKHQKYPAVLLSEKQAVYAADSFIKSANERSWRILSGAAMTNHVHLVVTNCPDDGPAVRRIFKGTSQAALRAYANESRRWWTKGGSDRYLHGEDSVEAAMRYVRDQHAILVAIENNEIM